jgi:hypothetical protein
MSLPRTSFSRRIAFIVLLIYFLWFWSNGGQTLAMKTWRSDS